MQAASLAINPRTQALCKGVGGAEIEVGDEAAMGSLAAAAQQPAQVRGKLDMNIPCDLVFGGVLSAKQHRVCGQFSSPPQSYRMLLHRTREIAERSPRRHRRL